MADLIIRNGIVITMDRERRVIEDGAVAIADERIVAVGDTASVTAAHTARRVVDARHKVVMPGLIDVHAHAGHGLVKTMGGGDPEAWTRAIEQIYATGSSLEFWRAEAQLSALERLKSGTTCGLSLLGGYTIRTDDPDYGAAHCEANAEIGIRSVLAVGSSPPPFPRRFARWDGATKTEYDVPFARQRKSCETLIDRWHGGADGRITIFLAAPVYTPSRDQAGATKAEAIANARAMRELSRARGVRFTQDGHHTGTVKAAHEDAGLLGPDALLSHCIDIDSEEMALLRDTGTSVAHNPSAVFSIRGRCPAPELIDMGVTVAIGSDGTAPDRNFDMFRHMFQCMHYHRRHFRDSSVLPPGKALEMVTVDAAKALGMEDRIGALEPGKQADVILVDMRKPHLLPLNMPVFRIAYFANAADVDTVIVAGRVLMEGRKVQTVNEDDILDAAQRETTLMLERTGLASMLASPAKLWGHTHL